MEMDKISNNMFPITLNNIFALRATPYNLRNPVSFKLHKVHLVFNGVETLSHLGPNIWSFAPREIKQSVSLGDSKSKSEMDSIHLSLKTIQKIFASSRIHLKRLTLTTLALVSNIIKHISNI